MRKMKLLCLLPILCLSACSKNSYIGTYEFRLGKTDGSHFGISVVLKGDTYVKDDKPTDYKKMTLSAEVGDDFSLSKLIESYEEEYPIITILLSGLIDKLNDVHEINGYYSVTQIKNDNYGYRLNIGSDFINDFLRENYPEIFEEFDFDIDPNMIEKFACAYVDNKILTFQIPVSLLDLQQQLVWYGYYVDPNGAIPYTQLDLSVMPGAKDEYRYGTHPAIEKDEKGKVVKDEITTVNQLYKYTFSHTILYHDGLALGSFVSELNSSNQQVLYFKPFDSSMSPTDVTGYVYVKDAVGEFDTKKNIKFSFAPNSNEVSVTYNHQEGKDEGFADADGTQFTFNELMQKPFIFRDFHDVKVGLTKN